MNFFYLLHISLLFSTATTTALMLYPSDSEPRQLQTPFRELDGKFSIAPVYQLLQYIEGVLSYDFNQNSERPCLLHDLAQKELTEGIDPQKAQKFLYNCLTAFVQSLHTGNHVKNLMPIKSIVNKLVEAWGKERNKEDSSFFKFCMNWQTAGTEVDILMRSMNTICQYEEFLMDFRLFLLDVLYSFPKSRAAVIEKS